MTEPLVSVLIPAFDAEATIAETLQSVLAQTWPRLEIVVVNDGSADRTAEITKGFDGVRLIQGANRGAAAARNAAYRESAGDYIVFLDADDVLHPEKIERQVRLLEAHPGEVSCCRWGRFDGDVSKAAFRREPVWADMDPVGWIATSWLGGGMMFPGAWMVPRAIADAAGPWDESLSLNDDGEYFTRVLLAGGGVRFSDEAVVYYRIGGGANLSASKSRAAFESGYRVCELATVRLMASENSERTRKASATMYQRFAYDCFATAPDLAAKAEARAAELGGSDLKAPGGSVFQTVASVAGWKTAKRLQSLVRGERK